jgi:hypothetical protein
MRSLRSLTKVSKLPLRAVLTATLAVSTFLAASQNAATSDPGVVSIPFLTPQEMPATDARAAADSQAAIARSALIYGYTLDASYSYREIACPFTPDHILLSYESSDPNGAASRFTAIVPRGGRQTAAIQVVSISHFGSVPFLPAGSNPHTFELFNRIVTPAPVAEAAAENPTQNPLLVRGLCYLAMIGEPPSALSAPSLDPATVHAPVPTLQFREKGTVSQVISVRNSRDAFQVWTLTFARNGKLLTAERVNHPVDTTPPLVNAGNGTAPVQSGNPAPAAASVSAPASPVASPSPTPASSPVVPSTLATTPSAPASPETPAPSAPTSPVAAAPVVPASPAVATPAAPATANVAPPTAVTATPAAAVDAAAPNTAPVANSAYSGTPVTKEAPVAATPSLAGRVEPRAGTPQPAAIAVAKPPVSATVVPRPPQRLILNLPLPPSRVIPDKSLPYPPQAPVK